MSRFYVFIKKTYFLIYAVLSMWKRPSGSGKRRTQRRIELNIPDMHMQRRLYYLCAYFHKGGFFTSIVMSPKQVMNLNKYGIRAFRLPGTRLSFKSDNERDILVHHGKVSASGKETPKIELSVDVFTMLKSHSIQKHDLFFPIGFHPHNLQKVSKRDLEELRTREKQIGLFFAGNIDKEKYNNPNTDRLFAIMNRWEAVQVLLNASELSGFIVQPRSFAELTELLESGDLGDKIVVCDSKKAPVPKQEWFSIISQARYFFAPPGIVQPYCHNLVEAMAVGTVPVTQLSKFYHPELIDSKNAVCFDTRKQLIEKVLKILTEPVDAEEQHMQAAVVEYYEKFFSPKAFREQLNSYIENGFIDGRFIFSHNKESVKKFDMYMENMKYE